MAAPDDAVPWKRPVFSVDAADYAWADVADFARRDGGWAALIDEVVEGVACQQAGYSPTAEAVAAMAKDFRYSRRLITAEETEAWLRRRAVTVRQWMDYVRRSVLRNEHEAALAELTRTHPFGKDSEDLVWPTGRCSGRLDALARSFAERVAVHKRLTGTAPTTLADLDDVMDELRQSIVTERALEDVIGHRRLDWLRVAMEQVHFHHEGAAREAVLSVRDDGLSLTDVSALANARRTTRTALLEELGGPMRAAVLGAGEGELLGPVARDDGFVLARVESKTVPTLHDPEIRQRAVDVVVSAAIRREAQERVRWHDQ